MACTGTRRCGSACDKFVGDAKLAAWLPNERFAKAWAEYVKTSEVTDPTPPPSPTHVQAIASPNGVTLSWSAEIDLESGLRAFIILRDGKSFAQYPEKPQNKFGRVVFQNLSYGDTPVEPIPSFNFTDTTTHLDNFCEYRIIAVNGFGLESVASESVRPVESKLKQVPAK